MDEPKTVILHKKTKKTQNYITVYDALYNETQKQIDRGVTRSIASHNFGSIPDQKTKLKCLDELLRSAGNAGLHKDILDRLDPQARNAEQRRALARAA